jgi:enoyl-CoA hydratase/carnithine racemase
VRFAFPKQESVMSSNIRVSLEKPIMEITIERPEKKNALTSAMFAALARALTDAEMDPSIAVVVILGSHDTFTAGADLNDFLTTPPLDPEGPVPRFLRALSTAEKVIVAGVSGPAVGIGTTMLLHCDLAVAGRSARFLLPFVDRALVPEAASSLLLPRLIGHRLACEHLLLCEPFDADTALRYGLVNRVVNDADVAATAHDLARRIAAKPTQAVRIAKRLLRGGSESVSDRILEEYRYFAGQLKSPEFAQAVANFFAKAASR